MTSSQIAERKAHLAARATLERMRLTLALHSVRTQMMPPPSPRESPFRRPLVAILIGFAAKRVGPAKLRRWIRIASYATAAYRIAASLRR